MADKVVTGPFSIGGNDVPGGKISAGVGQHLFVGSVIVIPEFALVEISGGELPMFFRILLTGAEAFGLFFAGDVEEEFQDGGAAVDEHAFEASDLMEAAGPEIFVIPEVVRKEAVLVHTDDEDIFVVAAVEDGESAESGGFLVDAPEKIVAKFFGRRGFEAGDVEAGRVDCIEDLADGTVFARRIEALKDEKERAAAFGVENILKLADALRGL